VSWILIIFGLPAAVFPVGEMVSRTERLRRMRLYLGSMGFVAAALPGLGTALEGFSLMANLLRIGLFIAERLSPDRARGEETERPAEPDAQRGLAGRCPRR